MAVAVTSGVGTLLVHPHLRMRGASLIKLQLLFAALEEAAAGAPGVQQALDRYAPAMIERSDNEAATALWNALGGQPAVKAVDELLHLEGARFTRPLLEPWDGVLVTGPDELTLFTALLTSPVLSQAARAYAGRLTRSVIDDQRWGVPAAVPDPAAAVAKNGWLPLSGANDWVVSSVGCTSARPDSTCLAVLTEHSATFGQGQQLVEEAARVALHVAASTQATRSRPDHQRP